MAKGKFKKQMHEKGMDLQKLRSELVANPTPKGKAVADSYNHNTNYIDSIIDDLFEESNTMSVRGRDLEVADSHLRARETTNKGKIAFIFYINCPEMTEYSDKFNPILRERTLYFVPDLNGLKIYNKGNYPSMRVIRECLNSVVEHNKEYHIHKIVSRDNRKVWFIDL